MTGDSRFAAILISVLRRCAKSALVFSALLGPAVAAWAQLEQSVLRGKVSDPEGNPLPGAQVVLLDQRGAELQRATGDAGGHFLFRAVAPGSYYVRASREDLVLPLRSIVLGSALAIDLDLRLAPRSAETVTVTTGHERPALATRTSLSGESVKDVPARLDGRGLRGAIASTPGWSTEDNGLMHVRGVDDGFLFVIDGIPLYERFDLLFGISPEPALVSSMNVITGHLPAEFGLKSGGVIEISTGVSERDAWSGALEATRGSESTGGASGQVMGPLARNAVIALYGSGEGSDRFLDPVDPGNLHDRGSAYQGDARLFFEPSSRDSVTVGMRYGHSDFDVPNSREQEAAGQDQRQGLDHALPLASWQRSWSSGTVSRLALVGSFTKSDLRSSPNDTPLSTSARRSGSRTGMLGSVTRGWDGHVLKTGFEVSRVRIDESFSFHVTDPDEAEQANLSDGALLFDAANPFLFTGRTSGVQASVYLQDTWRALPRLVLDLGVRFDRSALPRPETSWGPRVGLAWSLDRNTTLRASVNRYFQPPQPEWLLLSSSPEARVLSPFAEAGLPGGALPRAERQTGFEVGGERRLADALRLDLALWYRQATNVSDPNVFFGTTIVFPNSVGEQRAKGLDVRLDFPHRRGFGGYASYTLSEVAQYGPITGGLFLEDDFLEIGPGTRFVPDHDQRHVAAFGANYRRAGFGIEATGRYESGTPLGVSGDPSELANRPGADRVDFSTGRVKPRLVLDLGAGLRLLNRGRFALEARLEGLNLTNAAYVFNFGNPFSGTHFGPPRTFAVKLRVASREPDTRRADVTP
jgi:outer membrane receptor protein involved in Fe transport